MNLYKENYLKKLTGEDQTNYEKLKKECNKLLPGFYWTNSKKLRHYLSLFPNNFLDRYDIIETNILSEEKSKLEKLLDKKDVNERKILNFINNNEYYHIIGCILKRFPFGHHGAYLFKEFNLGTSFKADYLLIGDSSDGYHMIFVELEAPNGKIVNKNGKYSINVNKGINQVEDWKIWIEKNFHILRENLEKSKREEINLPKELYEYDSTRISYLVISGRRKDYSETTYRMRREYQINNNIFVWHYDNLIDCIDLVNIKDKDSRNY